MLPAMKSPSTLLAPAAAGALDLTAATEFSANGIVSRGVLSSAGLRVTLFGFAAGQELTEHTSSSRAIIQMLSGSSTWTIAGEARTLRTGELLHLPPGTPHAVRAEEPFSMLLTLVREPAASPLASGT
jgi:quercetin dioxygenase-like cupin family protein